MIIIPFADLERDTLLTLLEEIVTRDGTDYGVVELSTERKVEQVLHQLQKGLACLMYDNETQSCSVVLAEEAKRWVTSNDGY